MIHAGLFRDLIDNYRMGRTSNNAFEGNVKPAETGAAKYLKSIKPQVEKTDLDKKYRLDEYKHPSRCVSDLYNGIEEIFEKTTIRANEEIKSGKDAVKAFDKLWRIFQQCWNKNVGNSANREEMDDFKAVFSSSLEISIDAVIEAQATAKEQSRKKMQKIEDRIDKRHGKDEKKEERRHAKKAAK